MRPTNRLFLLALIFFLLFGTVPAVNALAAGTDFVTAEEIYCDDPPLSYSGEIKEVVNPDVDPAQEDYWKIYLVAGQKLTIDIDALESESSKLDSFLQVFNEKQELIGMNDQSSEIPLNEDPYLEIRADVDGDYFLVISASTPGAGDDAGTYSFLIKCSDPSAPAPVDPVKVGDLLGSTGAKIGSLVTINPADGAGNVRFPSVTGPIADIEYQHSTHKLFLAIDNDPGAVITMDPDTGIQGPVINLDLGAVIALEDAASILYGIHVVADEQSGEEQYSLVTIDQSTGELAFLVSLGQRAFSALAYHSAEKILYGVVPGTTGADLVKIDLTSLEIVTVGPTGLGQIVALDFSHDNILYGVELSGTLFYVSDLTTGQAEKIAAIDVSTEVVTTVTAATSAAPTGVSGLTFVVGEPTDDEPIKTMCSSTLASQMAADSASADHKLSKLKRNKLLNSGAVGLFKFQAAAGENIIIRLAPEAEEVAVAEEESSVSQLKASWPSWQWKGKGRLFLGLRDAIPGVKIRERTKGTLPLELEVENLAEGQYYIMVIQPLFRFNKVDYCLTLDSSYDGSQAWESLEVAWPSDDSENDSASTSAAEPEDVQKSTESVASASADDGPVALSTTAIAPTSVPPEEPAADDGADPEVGQTDGGDTAVEKLVEVTVEEPVVETPVEADPALAAEGADPEVVQTLGAETPVVEPVAEIPVVTEPAADGADPEVGQTSGDETTVEEPVVVTVEEPVVETPVAVDPAADDGSGTVSGDDDSGDEAGDDTQPDEEYFDDPMEDPLPMKG